MPVPFSAKRRRYGKRTFPIIAAAKHDKTPKGGASMNHPKLKHPKLCRILTYIIVLGCGLLPILAVSVLPVSSDIQVLVVLASLAGLLVFLFKNVFSLQVNFLLRK